MKPSAFVLKIAVSLPLIENVKILGPQKSEESVVRVFSEDT